MSANLKKKVLLLVVVEIIFLVGLCILLLSIQTQLALNNKKSQMASVVESVRELKAEADTKAASEKKNYDEDLKTKAEALAWAVNRGAVSTGSRAELRELADEILNVENILILDADGKVQISAYDSPADFTFDRYNQLKAVTKTGKASEAFEVDFDADTTRRYYAARIDTGSLIVIEKDPSDLYELLDSSNSWQSIAGNVSVSSDGFMAVMDMKTNFFEYYPDESMIGQNVLFNGIEAEQIHDGYGGWVTIAGQKVYAEFVLVGDSMVICCVPESEIIASRNLTIAVIMAIFFIVTVLMICYAIFVIGEQEDNPDSLSEHYRRVGMWFFNVPVGKKIAAIALIGTVSIFLGCLYMQNLFSISLQALENNDEVESIETTIAANEENISILEDTYNARYLQKTRLAAYILTEAPELETRSGLQNIADVLGVKYIYRIDSDGKTSETNAPNVGYELSGDEEEDDYIFLKLLNGADYVTNYSVDDVLGECSVNIGVTMYTADGVADGFVEVKVLPEDMEAAVSGRDIGYLLGRVRTGGNGVVFAIDKESGKVAYYPNSAYIGKHYSELGIEDKALSDSFTDFISINNESYYVSSLETGSYYIYAGTPKSSINSGNVLVTTFLTVISFICLVVICLLLSLETTVGNGKEESDGSGSRYINIRDQSGRVRRTESALSRWSGNSVKWDELSSGGKFVIVFKLLLGIFAVIVCLLIAFSDTLLDEHSAVRFVLSGNWARGVNIFSLTGCFLYICIIATVTIIIRSLLSVMGRTFDTKVETVARLLSSLARYVSVIVALYMCFALFGVDTATLLASAGILSLVIGLGAQKLVQDIIAGLFIIFEGEYRVGDVITVDGNRGTVMEIGVRTTKISEAGGNVRIINNSDIGSILNMTKENSMASIDVSIEYGESLERVESILAIELPHMRERLPAILDGPYYKGVTELGDSSVDLRIMAQCKEGDRFQLVRDLNREFKLIFDKYDINIPFPQVVVNQPVSFEEATRWQKQRAEEFAREQSRIITEKGSEAEDPT